MEGSGSGSVYVTNGSRQGSWRSKIIRIRIHNPGPTCMYLIVLATKSDLELGDDASLLLTLLHLSWLPPLRCVLYNGHNLKYIKLLMFV